MTRLDSPVRVTRYAEPRLRPRRPGRESSMVSGKALGECSTAYLIESSRGRDARVRAALEYVIALEADPDADDFAIVWARHELLRCMRASKEEELFDG